MPCGSDEDKASAGASYPPTPDIHIEDGAVGKLRHFFDAKASHTVPNADKTPTSSRSSLSLTTPTSTPEPSRPPPDIPRDSYFVQKRPTAAGAENVSKHLSPVSPLSGPQATIGRRQSQNEGRTTHQDPPASRRTSTPDVEHKRPRAIPMHPAGAFRLPNLLAPQDHFAAAGRVQTASAPLSQLEEPACYHCSKVARPALPQAETPLQVQVNVEDTQGNTKSFGKSAGLSAITNAFRSSGNFFKQRSQTVNDILIDMKDEVLDLTMMATVDIVGKSLCAACSRIPFGQFRPNASPIAAGKGLSPIKGRLLHKIVRNRDSCKFFGLFFQALCLPENNPLKAPPVQKHIQKKFEGKSFKEWADMQEAIGQRLLPIDSTWPFGASRDSVKSEPQFEAAKGFFDDPERRDGSIAAAAGGINVGLAGAAAAENDPKRARTLAALGSLAPSMALFATLQKQRLQCWVLFELKDVGDEHAGLIIVDVYGHGRGDRAPQSLLSHFHIRVASGIAPQARVPTLRYANRLKSDEIDLAVMTQCLHHCRSSHGKKCDTSLISSERSGEDTGIHTDSIYTDKPWQGHADRIRLIDVRDKHLCEVRRSTADYACLSYTWGGLQALTLQTSNLGALKANKGLEHNVGAQVPKTIVDAMTITEALGLRYLWVDALCVIQDRREKDNQHHVSQMDRIYGDACITIVAADCRTANSGIPGVKKRRDIKQIVEELVDGVFALVPFAHDLSLQPWDSRAWTIQERYLSKRLLIFSGGHVRFFCRAGSAHEDVSAEDAGITRAPMDWTLSIKPKTSPVSAYAKKQNGTTSLVRSAVFSEYARLVQEYTSRSMSFQSDALRAVKSLLRLLEETRDIEDASWPKPRTHFGLPEEFLDLALLWQPPAHTESRIVRRHLLPNDMPSGELPPPSWSWAAWEVCGNDSVRPKIGIRYEEPFLMNAFPDNRLRKVVDTSDKAEERVLPMLRWHRWAQKAPPPVPLQRNPNTAARDRPSVPVPLNGTGLGLLVHTADGPVYDEHFDLTLDLETLKRYVPDERHLIVSTTVAKFRLGKTAWTPRKETIWQLKGKDHFVEDHEFDIYETEIVNRNDPTHVVGRLLLPDRDDRTYNHGTAVGRQLDFIAISEAQCFGDEKLSEISGYPLYNVMLVKWQVHGVIAERVALGKIYKHAWVAAKPEKRTIILA